MRSNGKSETIVFYEETDNNKYLHWRSFMVKGTLRTLIRRSYTVFSNDNHMQEEVSMRLMATQNGY